MEIEDPKELERIQNEYDEAKSKVSAQGQKIKDLKKNKAGREEILAEVETLNDLKAEKKRLEDLLFPPTKLDINKVELDKLLIERLFVMPSFDIYGGTKGLFDLGPPGCAVKANIINFWRNWFVLEENILEIDTPTLTPEIVFKVSGHTEKFVDLMVKDVKNGICHRADHLLEDEMKKLIGGKNVSQEKKELYQSILNAADNYTAEELHEILTEYNIKAPNTGNDISEPFEFNLMFETKIGPTGEKGGFFRPETAQNIFVNFPKLLKYNKGNVPFAAATIGNAYRNEIAPRNGLIRVREFCLAEIEHFLLPSDKSHKKFDLVKDTKVVLYPREAQVAGKNMIKRTVDQAIENGIVKNQTIGYFMARIQLFLVNIGIIPSGLRFRQHLSNEMAFYAEDCWDAEILTSYGWIECVGLADRACHDLTVHANYTGENMSVFVEFEDGPKEIDTFRVIPNKKKLGPKFKKEAGNILKYLNTLSDVETIERYITELKENNKITITVEDKTYELDNDLVSIKSIKKTIRGEYITPHVIEPSFGIGRIIHCVFEHAFTQRAESTKKRILKFSPVIAPVKCVILPINALLDSSSIIPKLTYQLKKSNISYQIDDNPNTTIGKRYARNDEIGVPFAITIDSTTLEDNTVTIRDRDSTLQVRAPIDDISSLIFDLSNAFITWEEVQQKYESFMASNNNN
eukprot:TRINITY_DN41_c0_g2_i1.p1 TRINITY_DN41_c0_g2~~TRINITY_DN41_c0_g2_i1.p1  ORF type:complete len:695 (-),score=311.05 TRINITY_DN41_c0_g2_i1:219-2282(-)